MMPGRTDDPGTIPNDVTGSRGDAQSGANVSSDPQILVTGDAPDELQHLRWMLRDFGYSVLEETNGNGSAAKAPARPDLVLVNFATVPKGPERLEALREKHGKPFLCLLPCPDEQEIARVGRLTADSLVFKPLRHEDLASRLRLVLWKNRPENTYPMVDRRFRGRRRDDRGAALGPARPRDSFLQVNEREKTVLCGGRELHLTHKEYLLLSLLASDPGRVFSKREIIARIWPESRRAAATDVQQYICLLRKKIEPDPSNPRLIKTVPSFGYKLVHSDEVVGIEIRRAQR